MGIRAKLAVSGVVIAATIAYSVYLGASSSWQYYLHVDECMAQADQFRGKRVRLSGRVATGSLKASPELRHASFDLEGTEHKVSVSYRGSIPDNLAEGREVVVDGTLASDGNFQCTTLITRCASKYAPQDSSNMPDQEKQTGPAE